MNHEDEQYGLEPDEPSKPRDEWYDFTVIGSAYEQQFEPRSGRWRHRPLRLGLERLGFGKERGYGEWHTGPAPK